MRRQCLLEDKLLTDEIFRETAKLLKHDSDQRKKREAENMHKRPALKHYHSDGYQVDDVSMLSVDTSASDALLKYLGAMEPAKEDMHGPLTPGNPKDKTLSIGLKKSQHLHIKTKNDHRHSTPTSDQMQRSKRRQLDHAFSSAFSMTPQSVGFANFSALKHPNSSGKMSAKKIFLSSPRDDDDKEEEEEEEEEEEGMVIGHGQK